jgi:hypothetical protein
MAWVTDTDLTGTSTAQFSPCRTYRYTLTRTWGDEPPAVFVMLNPSTADAMADDPTIRRCKQFARRERCGGLAVVNLFALRATDPRELRGHPDPVGEDNDWHIRERCAPAALIVAAWGAHGSLRGRDRAVTEFLRVEADLRCLGVTASGAPRHPLYVRGDAPLMPYQALA